MITTQVDLIEKVGGGSCRCMLVEDWSKESGFLELADRAMQTSSVAKKHEFEITHERDDFFDSDLETSDSDVFSNESAQEAMPFADYWDRQFEAPTEDLQEVLLDLELTTQPTDIKMKAGKRFRRV